MASKTKYGVFEGKLYYSKLFTDNMDDHEYHEKTQGQFNTVFIPKDEKRIKQNGRPRFP